MPVPTDAVVEGGTKCRNEAYSFCNRDMMSYRDLHAGQRKEPLVARRILARCAKLGELGKRGSMTTMSHLQLSY